MFKKNTQKPRLSITLSTAHYQQLNTLAVTENTSLATIVRRIIQKTLDAQPSTDKLKSIEQLQKTQLQQIAQLNALFEHCLGHKLSQTDWQNIKQKSKQIFAESVATTQE